MVFRACWILLLMVGCARPNYAPSSAPLGSTPPPSPAGEPPAPVEGGPATGPKPSACAVKFASKHCVTVAWEVAPTEEETGSFSFTVTRPDPAGPVPEDLPGRVAVVAWMPGMGHGSSPIRVQRLSVGAYRATEVFFTMRGEWELRFLVKDGDETRDQAILPLIF